MKILQKSPFTLAVLLPVLLFYFGSSIARAEKLEIIDPEVTTLKESISGITDPWLRKALSEFLETAISCKSPSAEEGSNQEEVSKLYRESWRVYCNFAGIKATCTESSVEKARATTLLVYEFVLKRISWISDRKVTDTYLAKSYADIKGKRDWFFMRAVTLKP